MINNVSSNSKICTNFDFIVNYRPRRDSGPYDPLNFSWDHYSIESSGHEIYVRYDDSSDMFRQKMYVETYYKGERETYLIDISSINPENATRVEMFVFAVDKFGSGYGSNKPHPANMAQKVAQIGLIASTANPLYTETENPSDDYFTARMNYVELARGLLNISETDKILSPFSDEFLIELLQLFGESLGLDNENNKRLKENTVDYGKTMLGNHEWEM